MFAEPDFTQVPAFQLRMPDEQTVPFVFNSPHSGRHYPERFLALSRLCKDTIRKSEDYHVEEMFADVLALGAPLVTANFPRAYLDVNREPYELDPKMFSGTLPPYTNFRSMRVAGGLGTVPRLVAEGQEIYRHRLPVAEAEQRIENVYKPYHAALRGLLARTHRKFGFAVLIDCHSMPSSVRLSGERIKPDFIIGDRFGTSASAAISEHARVILQSMDYLVTANKPYAGGFITEHYGRPEKGLHALQLEINRGLYFNEAKLKKTAGFARLKNDLTRFAERLVSLDPSGLADFSMAAE